MNKLFVIIFFQLIFSQNIHRGCMLENNSRTYGSRPVLNETHPSLSGNFLIHYDNIPSSDDAPSLSTSTRSIAEIGRAFISNADT